MEKKEIRKQVFAQRKLLTEEQLQNKSNVICEKIIGMDAFVKAKTIFVYMDCKGEVSTKPLIEAAWKLGKTVAAPRVHGENMTYYEIRSYEDVAPGYYDIPEPVTEKAVCDEQALLIVPGVGFDANRHRCGYGKGFYDRYLSAHTEHTTIAVAFEFQMMEEVPADVHDIFPEYLITEERFFADADVLLESIGQKAKATEPAMRALSTADKNAALIKVAD